MNSIICANIRIVSFPKSKSESIGFIILSVNVDPVTVTVLSLWQVKEFIHGQIVLELLRIVDHHPKTTKIILCALHDPSFVLSVARVLRKLQPNAVDLF